MTAPALARDELRRDARRLRAQGFTYRRIGSLLGITSNRAWQMAHDVPLRLVRKPVDRAIPVLAPERPRQPLADTLPICVCGALESHHRNGTGSCAAMGCPRYFARGE